MIVASLIISGLSVLVAGWAVWSVRDMARLVRELQMMRESGAPLGTSAPVVAHRAYATMQDRDGTGNLVGVPKAPPPGGSGIGHVTRVWSPTRHHDVSEAG